MGKHSLLVWIIVSSVKTGTRRIIRLRLERRTTEDSSSNQTNNERLPKFVQSDNVSCSIKTAIDVLKALIRQNAKSFVFVTLLRTYATHD